MLRKTPKLSLFLHSKIFMYFEKILQYTNITNKIFKEQLLLSKNNIIIKSEVKVKYLKKIYEIQVWF